MLALRGGSGRRESLELDYDELVHLDAEDLAETGIKKAYDELLPQLGKYVSQPARVVEIIDDEAPRYAVLADGEEYLVFSPEEGDSEELSWGRATYIFFHIVNRQLSQSTHRFYAFYGGNDLGGMFLTPGDAELAKASLKPKTEWPYLPTLDHPWYGQAH